MNYKEEITMKDFLLIGNKNCIAHKDGLNQFVNGFVKKVFT